MEKTIKRLIFAAVFLVLVSAEVAIAIFMGDNVFLPYVGYALIVIVIYCLVRIIVPDKIRLMPIYVFAFAVFTEVLMLIRFVDILDIQNEGLRLFLGRTFSWEHIMCYAAGCELLMLYELFMAIRDKNKG